MERIRGADGVMLALDRKGSATDPPVILLHGGGQTRYSWGGTARTLANHGWQALSVDLRGHGESDWAPRGDYRLSSFARDILAIIGELPARPALVGASLGGLTSLFLEGELAPGSSTSLVLVDVAPRIEQRGADRIRDFMEQPEGFADLDEAADAIAAYNPLRKRPSNLEGLKKNLREGEDGRWYWHWDPAFIQPKMRGDMPDSEMLDEARMMAASAALTVPALLVRGRMSDVVSEKGAQAFLDVCPDAEFVDVSHAGHMVAGDQNDVFTTSVVDFLDRHRPA
jgi:pimeloyl-ACP methyl ester carboxylesterase